MTGCGTASILGSVRLTNWFSKRHVGRTLRFETGFTICDAFVFAPDRSVGAITIGTTTIPSISIRIVLFMQLISATKLSGNPGFEGPLLQFSTHTGEARDYLGGEIL